MFNNELILTNYESFDDAFPTKERVQYYSEPTEFPCYCIATWTYCGDSRDGYDFEFIPVEEIEWNGETRYLIKN